ncbi:uncharacterized protein LOC133667459 [Apis cerana]|uniref:NADH dehydrogenase [ubiquinone] 1 beta subcomplex subunit 4 n=1 Tax=Apis cerana cerana TaxID=94128 RepID=A0A2A3E2C4_APICC|nr:uncharacterized protein LOC133667459 [Apis cerana]PBC25857.1 hypothetical protein APICC_01539 [Apis cerana cerana]
MSSSSFENSFDVSPKQREIIQWRDARRKELRQKYLKEIHNPMKQTMPVESAVMRLNGLRLQHEYITRVKLYPHLTSGFILLGSMFAGVLLLNKLKDDNEHLYRTGQISYADREFKFS